jgi:alkylation response protein AidB-like acyl-CoA dehydrogenase
MEKFRGVDYYGLETLLSEDERMIRDAVRDWVEAEFVPIVAEHHRAGTFPVSLIPKLGELGATAAPASTTSPTASSCRSWSAVIPACARPPRCRAAW